MRTKYDSVQKIAYSMHKKSAKQGMESSGARILELVPPIRYRLLAWLRSNWSVALCWLGVLVWFWYIVSRI